MNNKFTRPLLIIGLTVICFVCIAMLSSTLFK